MQGEVRHFGLCEIFLRFWFSQWRSVPFLWAAELTTMGTGSAHAGSRYSRRAPLHTAFLICSSAKISSLPEWEICSLQGHVWCISRELPLAPVMTVFFMMWIPIHWELSAEDQTLFRLIENIFQVLLALSHYPAELNYHLQLLKSNRNAAPLDYTNSITAEINLYI